MAGGKTGPTSYGYERRDGKLVAHPQEAPVRRRMFELFVEHQRKKTVAEILNAEGARTRSGAWFTGPTIGRLLQDETVVGIPGEAEAIVPRELFDRCQSILLAQQSTGGATRKAVHLFAGFVHCVCGQKMYVPSNTEKYVCGDCRAKIPTNDLEAIFCAQLAGYDTPDDALSDLPQLAQLWPTLSFDSRREIVECVVQRIEIADKKVTCCLIAL